jgi:predicted transcriptional regulator
MADRGVPAAGTPPAAFDLDELIAALRLAETDGEPAGATVQELSERMRMAPQTVRRYLRAGLASGRVRHVRVKRVRMNGVLALVDAYEWTEAGDGDG